jgi:hypothetical protein
MSLKAGNVGMKTGEEDIGNKKKRWQLPIKTTMMYGSLWRK